MKRKRIRTTVGVVFVVLVVWCQDGFPSLVGPGPRDSVEQATAQSPPHNIDQQWAEISRRTEGGFAGYFIDRTGDLVLLVTGSDLVGLVQTELTNSLPSLDFGNVRVEIVEFPFHRLYDWLWEMYDAQISNFSSSSIDEINNRIVIGFTTQDAVNAAQEVARELSIPEHAIFIRLEEPVQPHNLQDRDRPVMGGMKIQSDVTPPCSLGASVGLNAADPFTHEYFVTAYHCVPPGSFFVFQPDTTTWIPLGTIDFNAHPDPNLSGCPVNQLCKYAGVG